MATTGPARVAAAHVFVADLDRPALDGDDGHHLERVLRLRDGEVVTASDGRGGVVPCRFRPGGGLEVDGLVMRRPAPAPAITVGFALVKGGRPDLIVQKLTECGVDRIVPFVAARSVVRWDGDRSGRQLERLRRIAREAAMQSRRAWLPAVDPVADFAAVVAAAGADAALADAAGDPPTLARPTVLVGPEGGWSEWERSAAPATVRLGPHTLRSETAAMAAAILLESLRSGLLGASIAP